MTADRLRGSPALSDSTPNKHSSASSPQATDRRNASRRVLSCRVALTLPRKEVLYGFSVDVSRTGIGVNVPRKIDEGQECDLALSFFARGKTHKMNACGQILSCVCIGMDGFRASVRFTHFETGAAEILEEILQA
jgi:hypothetical protein